MEKCVHGAAYVLEPLFDVVFMRFVVKYVNNPFDI